MIDGLTLFKAVTAIDTGIEDFPRNVNRAIDTALAFAEQEELPPLGTSDEPDCKLIIGRNILMARRLHDLAVSVEIHNLYAVQLVLGNAQTMSLTHREALYFIAWLASVGGGNQQIALLLATELLPLALELGPPSARPIDPSYSSPRPNPDLVRLSEFMLREYPELAGRFGDATTGETQAGITDLVIERLTKPYDLHQAKAHESARQLLLAAENLRARANLLARAGQKIESDITLNAAEGLEYQASSLKASYPTVPAVNPEAEK